MKQSIQHFPIPYIIRRELAGELMDGQEYANLDPHDKNIDLWAEKHNIDDPTRYNLASVMYGLWLNGQVSEQWYNRDCVLWATVTTSDSLGVMFWSVSLEFVEGEQ